MRLRGRAGVPASRRGASKFKKNNALNTWELSSFFWAPARNILAPGLSSFSFGPVLNSSNWDVFENPPAAGSACAISAISFLVMALPIWLEEHQDFARSYALARQIQIEDLMDEILEIADDSSNDWIDREGPDGKKYRVFNPDSIRRSKLRIGARKWLISKLMPKRYGWK